MTRNEIGSTPRTDEAFSPELLQRLRAGELTPDEREQLAAYLQSPAEPEVALAYRRASFSGPLPPPQLLAQYDKETRQAILDMAQAEQPRA